MTINIFTELQKRQGYIPIVDFERLLAIVPFQDNIFGGADAAVERQHPKRVTGRKLGLVGKNWGKRVRYNIGGRVG